MHYAVVAAEESHVGVLVEQFVAAVPKVEMSEQLAGQYYVDLAAAAEEQLVVAAELT